MKRLIVLLLLLVVGSAQATMINVDLEKIDPEIAAKVIAEQQRIAILQQKQAAANAANAVPTIPKTVSEAIEWSNIGTNLATAVAATAKALSISVNEFAVTPVGWWTFAFLFWYILGNTLWHIVGGVLVWAVLGLVVWHSFRTFHIPQRRLVANNEGVKTYEYVQYEFTGKDTKVTSACFHAGFFILVSIIMLWIIF